MLFFNVPIPGTQIASSHGMSVLILKNIETEGPGTIEDFLKGNGIPYTVVDLSRGEVVPAAGGFDTLVMLGGPMSVNDDLRYIRDEEALARDFVAAGKKIFGICLGAQIMAKALGSRVYKGKEKEIGWYDIELTGGGLKDLLMNKLAAHPGGRRHPEEVQGISLARRDLRHTGRR